MSAALAWVAAHPFETLVGLAALLSIINGALPASVQSGPVGRVLHAVLDRLAVLTRSDARGTLKWPGVASALIVPPSVGPLAPPPDQGGYVEGGAMLGVCVLALASSLACSGCPCVREIAMRAAPGVPDPSGCVAGVQRCADGVPVVCSATGREWAALPRSASGEQRTCAPGVCVVSDAGVAYCEAP